MTREKIIVVLYPGCITFEVALAAQLLSEKYEITIATPDGRDLTEASGLPVKAQISFADVNIANCRAVLVPGGDPQSIAHNTDVDRILQDAEAAGLLIGGICAGPFVLAKAGILKGRRIAHGYQQKQLDFLKGVFAGVVLTDEMFVVDGNIITAKPEAFIDFAVEIACRLGAVDASKSGRLKEYYRGTLGRKFRPVALALIRNSKDQLLLLKAFDSVKKETFYRPLGGGIEFHESGSSAVEREIDEELGLKVSVRGLVATLESIFVHEGTRGHEIVMLFDTEFTDSSNYDRLEFEIVESGKVIGKTVWRSVEEIRIEKAKLYPSGIEDVLSSNISRE